MKTKINEPLTLKLVSEFAFDREFKLLSDVFVDEKTPMQFECLKCNKIITKTFDSFNHGNRCKDCQKSNPKRKFKLSEEEVAEYFKSRNCELIGEFKCSSIPVEFRCSCGNIGKISLNNFKSKNRLCSKCGLARRSASNHYCWREDRELADLNDKFRQKCYKLIKMVLNVTGRVKNEKSAKLLGYDYKALQDHVTNHPNWSIVKDNPWHIDHIFPIKAFIDHGISDLKIINSLDNLRPLGAKENLCKNAAYDRTEFLKYLESKGVSYEPSNHGLRAFS